jgi:hypothetical protein
LAPDRFLPIFCIILYDRSVNVKHGTVQLT